MGPIRRALTWVRSRLYNERTIARYFRAQGATIGEGTRLMIRALASEPYLVTIEDEVLISADVLLLTHDGATWVQRDLHAGVNKYGRIRICRRAFVGARAIVLPGVTVGERSIVGAGSVVTRDVPPNVVVAGVPARVVCTTDEYIAKARAHSTDLPPVGDPEFAEVLQRVL